MKSRFHLLSGLLTGLFFLWPTEGNICLATEEVSKSSRSEAAKQDPVTPRGNLLRRSIFGSPSPYPRILGKQGYSIVPSYFSTQPEPFKRPEETILPKAGFDSTYDSTGLFASTLPWLGGYGGYPYSWWGGPWGYGGWLGSPSTWGALNPYSTGGLAGGGWGLPWGYGGWGPYYSGRAYGWGLGGGPWWGYSPGLGALAAGALSGAFDDDRRGHVGPARVIQSGPSKPSGNYYAPSNVDPMASGSYYATTSPAITPTFTADPHPKDYWGGGSSPFGSDLNSVPWRR